MIRVNFRNNVTRKNDNFDENQTLREILTELDVDMSRGTIALDGATLGAGELNKTLADFGFDGTPGKDSCVITSIVKADNA